MAKVKTHQSELTLATLGQLAGGQAEATVTTARRRARVQRALRRYAAGEQQARHG